MKVGYDNHIVTFKSAFTLFRREQQKSCFNALPLFMRYKQLNKQTTGRRVKSLGIKTYVDQNRVNHLLKLFWHFNKSIISGDKCMFFIELFIKEIHSQMLIQSLKKQQIFMKETLTPSF